MNNQSLTKQFAKSSENILVAPKKEIITRKQENIYVPTEKEVKHYIKRFNRSEGERKGTGYYRQDDAANDSSVGVKTDSATQQATAAITSGHSRWEDQRLMEELAIAMSEEIAKIRSTIIQDDRPEKPLSEVNISAITANLCRGHTI